MKKIAFIGGFDKFDVILYTAIIVNTQTKSKCLIVDSTLQEKARYIVPTLEGQNYNTPQYITNFQGIDIAVGFKTKQELDQFGILTNTVDEEGNQVPVYDYIFIDLDEARTLESFNFNEENDLIFLATAFDLYSLNKAFKVLDELQTKPVIHKMLFGKKIKSEHITYIEYAAGNRDINWGDVNIKFPYDNGDWTLIFENQRENRLSLKKLSNAFKSGLKAITQIITEKNFFAVNSTVNRMERQEGK